MTTDKKQCVTCDKNAGIMTCNGCQQTFCGKHSTEHRQQLANQLDGILREHNSLQREFERTMKDQSLFQKIDVWEKESIIKIQAAAEKARVDLRQMLDKSKEPLAKTYSDMAMNLRSSREADDYSEKELNRWIKQIQQLKSEITSPSPIKVIENDWSAIKLITIKNNHTVRKMSNSITQDKFSKVIGSAILDEDGHVAKHTNNDWNYEYVLGEKMYAEGRHTILFKIEQTGTPYNMFFGCISTEAIHSRISINSPFTVGWFGFNQTYQHGIQNSHSHLHDYNSNIIATNDVLYLTFDCDKKQMELFHEDANKRYILNVDTTQATLPWQLLMMLTDKDDCVRILSMSKLHSNDKTRTNLLME